MPQGLLQANIELTIGKSLPPGAFDCLLQQSHVLEVPAKHKLQQEGDICRYIYFIEEGAAYSYQLDDQGNQHVVQIALRNFWISDLNSFFTSAPGMFNIVTHTACTLRVMDKDNFEHLFIQFPIFERFFRILMQNAYCALQQRIATFNSIDAVDRYKAFIDQYPDVMQQLPQYLIASYLGITAPSLSRIRKQLAKNVK
jgi:CRP-like cAMP-binding protein